MLVACGLSTATACGGSTRQGDLASAGAHAGSAAGSGASETGGDVQAAFGGSGGGASSGVAGGNDPEPARAGRDGEAGRGGTAGAGGCAPLLCDPPAPTIVGQPGDHFVPWGDSWFLTGCKATANGDCGTYAAACPSGGTVTRETFPINGTPGQHYKVTFAFNAVVELKQYTSGVRDAGNTDPAELEPSPADTFYRDGVPSDSAHNDWTLTVFDDKGLKGRQYHMNSAPPGLGAETGRTYLVSYRKAIVIVGGGKIVHEIADRDCLAVDNCGPGLNEASCPSPRNLPNEPNVLLPKTYEDPEDHELKPLSALSVSNPDGGQPWHSQLGHLTVQSIEQTNDPLSTNYP